MPETKIEINAAVVVQPRAEEPMRMTQDFATLDAPAGEKIKVMTNFPAPTLLILRGEKLVGTIDLLPLIQEAALHVMKKNYKESE